MPETQEPLCKKQEKEALFINWIEARVLLTEEQRDKMSLEHLRLAEDMHFKVFKIVACEVDEINPEILKHIAALEEKFHERLEEIHSWIPQIDSTERLDCILRVSGSVMSLPESEIGLMSCDVNVLKFLSSAKNHEEFDLFIKTLGENVFKIKNAELSDMWSSFAQGHLSIQQLGTVLSEIQRRG